MEDLLDVSRIISGNLRLDLQPTEVALVVGGAVEVVRPAAEAKQIELRLALATECIVAADAARLQQVIWNLVSNAVKFTPGGGRIDLTVRTAEGSAVIEVADTGAGIDPEFLPHVFNRFRQFDGSSTRRQGGLGLGLAIVRHLVELHGGSVAARSEGAERGATFTVKLPISRDAATAAEKAATGGDPASFSSVPTTPVDLQGLRILVVDDDEDSRSLLSTALVVCGAQVFSSASAEAALTQAASMHLDVLVCDIAMPGMDGYAMMQHLRAWPESAGGRTPAIAVTGFARREDASRALDAGFQEHASKPVDLENFTRRVARLAGRDGG